MQFVFVFFWASVQSLFGHLLHSHCDLHSSSFGWCFPCVVFFSNCLYPLLSVAITLYMTKVLSYYWFRFGFNVLSHSDIHILNTFINNETQYAYNNIQFHTLETQVLGWCIFQKLFLLELMLMFSVYSHFFVQHTISAMLWCEDITTDSTQPPFYLNTCKSGSS